MDFAKLITAACSLIRNNAGNILMIEHPDRGWDIPGGRLEKGEDIITCLKREVFEETGTHISKCRLAGIYQNLSIDVMVFAFYSTYLDGKLTTSPESLKVEWVDQKECLNKASHPVVHNRIKDLLEFRNGITYRYYTIDPYSIIEERII